MWYEMTSNGGTEKENVYKILVTGTKRGKTLERTKGGWKENLLQYMGWIPLNRIASYTVLLTVPFLVKTFAA